MLAGECEGFYDCYVSWKRATFGRYLEAYPEGDHAEQALGKLLEVARIWKDEIGREDAMVCESLPEWKGLEPVIRKSKGYSKTELLRHMEDLSKACPASEN